MFESLAKETEKFQELFKKIMKYHIDWVPEPPTAKARVKQVREWIEEFVASKTENTRGE